MKLRGNTIGDQLRALRKLYPKRALMCDGWGFMYRVKGSTKNKRWLCRLFMVLQNEDGVTWLHSSVARGKKEKSWNIKQWREYLDNVFLRGTGEGPPVIRDGVLHGAIIPKLNLKMGMQWDVREILGYTIYGVRKPLHPMASAKRNQNKRERVTRGQGNSRVRHRNRKRSR